MTSCLAPDAFCRILWLLMERRDTMAALGAQPVSELVIQPTAKFLKAGSILAAILFLGLEIAYLSLWTTEVGYWVMILPALLMLWPASRWLRRRTTRTVISGDRL